MVGFVVEALKCRLAIKASLSLEASEIVYAVITLGYPAERYACQAGRWPLVPR
ncbi:hypothetical protein DFAR_2210064 [Desulfarculales bacterium]